MFFVSSFAIPSGDGLEKEWRAEWEEHFLSLGQGLALPGHHQEAAVGGSQGQQLGEGRVL